MELGARVILGAFAAILLKHWLDDRNAFTAYARYVFTGRGHDGKPVLKYVEQTLTTPTTTATATKTPGLIRV